MKTKNFIASMLTMTSLSHASGPIVIGYGSASSCRYWAQGCFTDFTEAPIKMRAHAIGQCGELAYTGAKQLEKEVCTTEESKELRIGTTKCKARFVCVQ